MPTLRGQVAESHSLKEHKHNDRYLCRCLGKMSSAIYSATNATQARALQDAGARRELRGPTLLPP